ncbi:hypothetical protein [Scrofimicrobium sp. R131]|uniref:Uncharacterized protein n=1 Tax=Scrofimicrobium appendicitidis TaxID=3079930 RepID=A0AAU7V565_9ACTO
MSESGCGCGQKREPAHEMAAENQGGCGCGGHGGGHGHGHQGGCGCGGNHVGREGQPVDEAGRMNLGLRAAR